MPQSLASVEAAQLLRAQRVAGLQRQLQAGDFDAARYASTPRRRAEILAQVLTRAVSRSAMRRRLKSLGVSREYCGGTLQAISVEGGGIDVRRADGQGQVVTGPGVDAQLLEVFPELVSATLRNLTLIAGTGASYDPGLEEWLTSDPDPDNMAGAGVESWNFILFSPDYTASSAVVQAQVGRTSTHPFGSDRITQATVTSEHWNQSIGDFFTLQPWNGGAKYFPGQAFFGGPYGVAWDADGLNWLQTHAGQADAIVGATAWTATYNGSLVSAFLGLTFTSLTITYTDTGCDTCSLELQVNSACDGEPVGGGVFDLDNGMECTQDGSGVCTISDLPHGTYNWTWTKTGYDTQSGEYECACEGGSSDLFLDVIPTGGCDGPCDLNVTVTSACDGDPVEGISILIDGVVFCVTGADGTCSIEGVPLGAHVISTDSDDWQASEDQDFECEGEGTTPIAFVLTPNGGCPPEACRGDLAVGPVRSRAPFVRQGCERMAVGPLRDQAPFVRGPHA